MLRAKMKHTKVPNLHKWRKLKPGFFLQEEKGMRKKEMSDMEILAPISLK